MSALPASPYSDDGDILAALAQVPEENAPFPAAVTERLAAVPPAPVFTPRPRPRGSAARPLPRRQPGLTLRGGPPVPRYNGVHAATAAAPVIVPEPPQAARPEPIFAATEAARSTGAAPVQAPDDRWLPDLLAEAFDALAGVCIATEGVCPDCIRTGRPCARHAAKRHRADTAARFAILMKTSASAHEAALALLSGADPEEAR